MGIGRLGFDQKPNLEGQGDLVSRFIRWISRFIRWISRFIRWISRFIRWISRVLYGF